MGIPEPVWDGFGFLLSIPDGDWGEEHGLFWNSGLGLGEEKIVPDPPRCHA